MRSKNSTPRKQRGQIIILMMLAMVPAVLLIAYVFNGGALVAQRTKLQTTADTTALTEAAWTARTLNVMAMNNTAMAQSHAVASSAWALEGPLYKALFTANLVRGFYAGRIIGWAKFAKSQVYITAVAAVIFGILILAITLDLIAELDELKDEVERAIHKQDGSFGRAAAAMAAMNELMVSQAPDTLNSHSASQVASNFPGSTSYRFNAWAPDKPKTLQLPLEEVEFESLLRSNSGNAIENLIRTGKDFQDIDYAGREGTQTQPLTYRADFFGNFEAHGYEKGTGPFELARQKITAEYSPVRQKLDDYASGSVFGNILEQAVCKVMGELKMKCDCEWWNILCHGIKGVVYAIGKIFETLIGTIFQPLYEDDLQERMSHRTKAGTWEWTTWFKYSLFSRAKFFPGYSFLIGFYNGTDLKNMKDTFENSMEDIEKELDDFKNGNHAKVDECVQRKKAAEEARREQEYNDAVEDAKNADPPENPPPHPGSFEVTESEGEKMVEDCKKEVEDDPDKYDGSEGPKPGPDPDEEPSMSEAGDTGGRSKDKAKKDKGIWKTVRDNANWPYEIFGWVAGIKLPFPADAIAVFHPEKGCLTTPTLLGFIPSGLCKYETPYYSLSQQRVFPEDPLGQKLPAVGPISNFLGPAGKQYLSNRKDWSLLVAIKHPIEVPIAAVSFKDMPADMIAIAQAELYNTQWFDMFTQRWRAKLVPVSLLNEREYRDRVINEWKNELDIDKLFRLPTNANQNVLNH